MSTKKALALALGLVALSFAGHRLLRADEPSEFPPIENLIRDCVRIEPITWRREGNLGLVDLAIERLQSTGICGCKAEGIKYEVSRWYAVDGSLYSEPYVSGLLNEQTADRVTVVYSSDLNLVPAGRLKMSLSCRPHM